LARWGRTKSAMPYLAASCASNQPVVLQGIIMVDMFMSYVGAHVGCAGHGEAGGDAAAASAAGGARLAMAVVMAASSGGGAARAGAIGRRSAGGGGRRRARLLAFSLAALAAAAAGGLLLLACALRSAGATPEQAWKSQETHTHQRRYVCSKGAPGAVGIMGAP